MKTKDNNIKKILLWGTELLNKNKIDSASLDAELLLSKNY